MHPKLYIGWLIYGQPDAMDEQKIPRQSGQNATFGLYVVCDTLRVSL